MNSSKGNMLLKWSLFVLSTARTDIIGLQGENHHQQKNSPNLIGESQTQWLVFNMSQGNLHSKSSVYFPLRQNKTFPDTPSSLGKQCPNCLMKGYLEFWLEKSSQYAVALSHSTPLHCSLFISNCIRWGQLGPWWRSEMSKCTYPVNINARVHMYIIYMLVFYNLHVHVLSK